jgi:hypothetical protein
VPYNVSEIQSTPPHGHPVLTSAYEPILVVAKPGVELTFKSVIDETPYVTDSKLIDLLHADNANLTHKDRKTSIGYLHIRCNFHPVSY